MRKVIATFLTLLSIFCSSAVNAGLFGGGGAGGIVFDPTNYAQNLITAAQTSQSTQQLLQQNIYQLQNLLIQKLQSMGLSNPYLNTYTAQLMGQLTAQQNLYSANQSLYGSLGSIGNLMANRSQQAQLAGLTWQQYVQQEQTSISQGNQAAQNRAQMDAQAMQKVQDDYSAVQKYEAQIPANQGIQQSLQLLNSQMDRVITQNATLIQQFSQKDLDEQANEAVKRQASKQTLTDQYNQAQQQQQQNQQQNAATFQRIIGQ